jgi:uncharacterized protein YjiS (DUF1127 family)
MATLHATASSSAFGVHRLKRGIEAFFAGISAWYDNYLTALSRSEEFQRLNDMSDTRLAELGLRREDIARHVFRDVAGQ